MFLYIHNYKRDIFKVVRANTCLTYLKKRLHMFFPGLRSHYAFWVSCLPTVNKHPGSTSPWTVD